MADTFSARTVCANFDFATFYYIEPVLKVGEVNGIHGPCFGIRYRGQLIPKGAVPMGCLKFNWKTARTEVLLDDPEMNEAQKAAWEKFFAAERDRFNHANVEQVVLEDWVGHGEGQGFNVFIHRDFAGCIRQNPKNGTAEVFMERDANDNPVGNAAYFEEGHFGDLGLEQMQRCIEWIKMLAGLFAED